MTKLLLLVDELDQIQGIRKAAAEAGFQPDEILQATNIEEAERQFAEHFDIAIVDLHLGDNYQDAAFNFIRDLHRRKPRCWIIAFTEKLSNYEGALAVAYGASDFVTTKWSKVSWFSLLIEKLSIYRMLSEGVTALPAAADRI